jgi:MraZ protein
MFIGEHKHTIDSKKRMAIPAKFRDALNGRAVVTRGIDNCLTIYSTEEWKKLTNKLDDLPISQTKARSFARMLLSGASDVMLDKLGRILIPDYLKEYAKLEKEVVILGISNKIEIWNRAVWEEYKKENESNVSQLAEELKDLGI